MQVKVLTEIEAAVELADKLKLLMESHGLTQKQLANKAGVSQNTIFKIASGITKNSRHSPAIAKVFGMTTEDFLSLEMPPESENSPAKARLLRKIEDANETALPEIEKAIDAILKADEVKTRLGI